jgi:hypothetical protein
MLGPLTRLNGEQCTIADISVPFCTVPRACLLFSTLLGPIDVSVAPVAVYEYSHTLTHQTRFTFVEYARPWSQLHVPRPEYLSVWAYLSVDHVSGPHDQVFERIWIVAGSNAEERTLTYMPLGGNRNEITLAESVHFTSPDFLHFNRSLCCFDCTSMRASDVQGFRQYFRGSPV